jgi:hypothetical protein
LSVIQEECIRIKEAVFVLCYCLCQTRVLITRDHLYGGNIQMRIVLNRRPIAAFLLLVFGLALLAACAPAATPTPTTAPTVAPTPTEEVVEAEPTEDPTEELTDVATEEPEAAEDADAEATEAAEADATEAGEDADAEATEAADAGDDASAEAASGDGMPGVVGVTSTRVRETPTVRGTVIVEIPAGTEVVALGETANAGYLYIRLEDGTEGWVSKQTINLQDRFATLPIMEP